MSKQSLLIDIHGFKTNSKRGFNSDEINMLCKKHSVDASFIFDYLSTTFTFIENDVRLFHKDDVNLAFCHFFNSQVVLAKYPICEN